MFIGRQDELKKLESLHQAKSSKLAVLYGRRRIGKSSLVEEFSKNKPFLQFEGLEGQDTPAQIRSFTEDLIKQIDDPILKSVHFKDWNAVFTYLTTYLKNNKKKTILFFDEFQWLAANQSSLVSLFKKFWDQEWKKLNVLIILCGSISSYMIKKVIKSKALYGRIEWEYMLGALSPAETSRLLKNKRSKEEILKYLLILGGIPRYLESIDVNKSFEQNMNQLFFKKDALFLNEYEKVFYSQFKEHRTYEKIVSFISEKPKTLNEISKHLKTPSSGGVKSYLDNLEKADFIKAYSPYDKAENTKLIRYKLTDEYLRFYFKFIQPNATLIKNNSKNNYLFERLTKDSFDKWLGFAFENFCMKNALDLAGQMNFADQVKNYGPAFDRSTEGFQVDLLFLRSDKTVTLCEIKHYNKEIDTKVLKEVQRKAELIKVPKGYTLEKALISLYGPDQALQNVDYFHHSLNLDNLFQF